ncbi:tyrosine-type recombinase/integrase [Deinococcus sp. 6YEL10]|uniref:tyrosine-type recombinase/integrase n=1 Tax=Deinococcus sp. 6YEL10 TaxID=2745870 RepID=UPI001E4CB1D9|nr:tyrosine-type recombinase/integrase [Deinococcus sp. 6YEL10]MCD0159686.1 tyrosine-type recombinase/integrase [Deinococcus sp. 6YEL10]
MNALVLATDQTSHTRHWTDLSPEERRRRTLHAIQNRDRAALDSLIEGWLILKGRKGSRVSPATLKQYRVTTGSLLAFTDQTSHSLIQPHDDFGNLYMRWLEQQGQQAASVQLRVSNARNIFDALRWAGLHAENPFTGTRAPAPTTKIRREGYTPDDIRTLLDHADARERVIVLLGADAGLRNQEITDLTWNHVNLHNRELRVTGKGSKTRTVPMTSRLHTALTLLGADSLFQRTDPIIPNTFNGQPITDDGLREIVSKLCTRAGTHYRAVHALRHTAGTQLYRATHDLHVVSSILGHADPKTTAIYAHMDRSRLHDAIAGMESAQ